MSLADNKPATAAKQDALATQIGVVGSNPGANTVLGRLKAIADALLGSLLTVRRPLTFTKVFGPVALTANWQKVATTTAATRGLRISPLATATTFDIEWVSVAEGATAPDLTSDPTGEPVFGGEDFPAGIPIGDIYLKSASGQTVTVKTGV